MDLTLNIIHYIYKMKGKNYQFATLSHFFNNGTSFPDLVSILYKKSIPDINKNIKSPLDVKRNEKLTLDFLKEQDDCYDIFTYKNISSLDTKIDLLIKIFIRSYFTETIDQVFNKSNLILKSQNIHFNSTKEIFCGKFLLSLLNVVTNGEIESKEVVNELSEFESIIVPSLQKAGVPLVISQFSFDFNTPDLFMIQIQIIFQIYKENISKILKNPINIKNQLKVTSDQTFKIVPFIRSNQPYPNNCYINIINYIFNENKINVIYDLYTGDINNLASLVLNITRKKFNFENSKRDQILTQISKQLGIKNTFSFRRKNDFFLFIQTIFQKFYFTNQESDNLLKYCFNILIDYGDQNSLHFLDFFDSKGYQFFIIIHRLIINRFNILKRDIIPPKNNFTFDQLKHVFDRFNIPFFLTEDSFKNKFDAFVFKFQINTIIKLFYGHYLNDLLKYKQKNVDDPLLKMMNVVGLKYGLRFDSYSSLEYGNSFQFFIESLLEKTLSDHINIKPSQTYQQSVKNIEIIVNYLKTQMKILNVIQCDITSFCLNRTIKFVCEKTLSLCFLKKTKNELIKRCKSIIDMKFPIQTVKDINNVGFYYYLLHFINNSNLQCKNDFTNWSTNHLNEQFKKAGVEKIIDDECIRNPILYENYVFYQIQIYFDRLDEIEKRIKPSLKVVEILLSSINALNKMKNKLKQEKERHFEQIAYNICVKRAYIRRKIVDIDFKQYSESNNYRLNPTNKKKSISFDDFVNELKKVEIKKKKDFNESTKFTEFLKNFEKNDLEITFKLTYNENLLTINEKFQFDFESFENSILEIEPPSLESKQKIFKFFIYNETNEKWEFNQTEFYEFMNYYGFNLNNYYTGLVLFINTLPSNLCTFYSYLSHSKFDSNQICIYAYNYDGPSITLFTEANPIYLFLSIPLSKKNIPNIETIIMKIYLYLYSISDIQIVLLNKHYVKDQIITTKNIQNILQNWSLNKSNDKSKTIFVINNKTDTEDNLYIDKDLEEKSKSTFSNLYIFKVDFSLIKKSFYDRIKNIIFCDQLSYNDIFSKLKDYSKFEVSSLYIKLKLQEPKGIDKNMDKLFSKRIDQIKLNKDPNFDINGEFEWIPDFDLDFLKKYQSICYAKIKSYPNIYDVSKSLKLELNNRASEYINYVQTYYENEVFLTPDKLALIHNSFNIFINEVFENIIKASCFSLISRSVYKDYCNIVDKMMPEFNEQLKNKLNNFVTKIEEKNKSKEVYFKDDFQRSTRYIMKEVENLKEIEVLVKLNGEVKDEIEQDF